MSSPRERLEKVLAAYVPSKVCFRPGISSTNSLFLRAHKLTELSHTPVEEDTALQQGLKDHIGEMWDPHNGRYYISNSAETLFEIIKRNVLIEYESVSERCHATKRKTENFIRRVHVDQKHLAAYLFQLFVVIKSSTYEQKSDSEKKAVLEPLESLRRTYGKP